MWLGDARICTEVEEELGISLAICQASFVHENKNERTCRNEKHTMNPGLLSVWNFAARIATSNFKYNSIERA